MKIKYIKNIYILRFQDKLIIMTVDYTYLNMLKIF